MLKDPSARLRRAIKENNLYVVRRIIERHDAPSEMVRRHVQTRIDMRNPDPGPGRYTSLAWAAVLGHEEIFEYLLNAGHDDEELSRDAENNTILIMLAGLRSSTHSHSHSRSTITEYPLQDVALRMARLYYERFPFLIDWSNVAGQTALHVASTKGNEEFVRMFCDLGADFDLPDLLGNTPLHYASAWNYVSVLQLLIERGCQFAARNNENFTASDYAFSFSTMNTLQETARAQFESNKRARRNIFAQAAARGSERGNSNTNTRALDRSKSDRDEEKEISRLRSGSGGSRMTSTTNSDAVNTADYDSSGVHLPPSTLKHYGPLAGQATNVSSGSSLGLPRPNLTPASLSSPSKGVSPAPPPASSTSGFSSSTSTNSNKNAQSDYSALSPVATRVRDRDADLMAEYVKRTRSGSGGLQSAPGTQPVGGSDGNPQPPESSHTSPGPNALSLADGVSRPLRRLKPSTSAASLRPAGIIGVPSAMVTPGNQSRGGASTSEIDLDFLNEALELHGAGGNMLGTSKLNPIALPNTTPTLGGTKPLDIRPKRGQTLDTLEGNNNTNPSVTRNPSNEMPPPQISSPPTPSNRPPPSTNSRLGSNTPAGQTSQRGGGVSMKLN